jgi:hypothetical protein
MDTPTKNHVIDQKKVMSEFYSEVDAQLNEFNHRIDKEIRRVLDRDGISIDTALKDWVLVYTPDGAARLCKDGKPISNVIYPPYNYNL